MSQNHAAHLEKDHFAADLLNDIVGTLKSRHEGRVFTTSFFEIVWKIVEEIDDKVVTILEVDKEIFRLGHEDIFRVGHHHHLGLLQNRLQVVELDIFVKR